MRVLLAGNESEAAELAAALGDAGVDAEIAAPGDLPQTMTAAEERLQGGTYDGAVTVGTSEASLALAIAAAKLGVPLAVCLGPEPDQDSAEGAAYRILTTLASESVAIAAGAERVVAWLGTPG